jgi:hypothetical protein
MMTHYQVTPQSCRLFAASGEGNPLHRSAWLPRNLYRAIAHANSVANVWAIVKQSLKVATQLSPSL